MEKVGTPVRKRKNPNTVNVLRTEDIKVPENVKDVKSSKMCEEWKTSMETEMTALKYNNTWELVDLPEGKKPIGCKWVFTVKSDKNGCVKRLRARLVAKGYPQKYDIDYVKTFSPVIKYSSVRLLIALAAEHQMFLHQMDVSSAYLNGELSEDVYMKQPEGFVSENYPDRVLKLKKSLYGLKQSGREWNAKLDAVLRKLGFTPCVSEPCLYVRNENGKLNFIAVYVDDFIFACSCKNDLQKIKNAIAKEFEVVDGGELKYFLGIEVEREGETGSITLGHKQYIENLLRQWNMSACRSVSTPLEAGYQVKCDNENCKKVDEKSYQSLIGSLMYLAITTRPDILHSVAKLAQRNVNPHGEHETAAKRILRYLRGTADMKLHYRATGKPVHGYVDADWANDAVDRKSYSGCVFICAGGYIVGV